MWFFGERGRSLYAIRRGLSSVLGATDGRKILGERSFAPTASRFRPTASIGRMLRIVLREVQAGVYAVLGPSGGVIRACSILLHIVRAEVLFFAVDLDVGDPLVPTSVAGDTDVLRRRTGRTAAVGVVLGGRAVAEVGLAIVQAVVVDVVADHAGRRVHQKAVQVDALGPALYLDRPHGIDRILVDFAVPAELRQPDIVLRIDLDEQALGQRDLTVVAEAVGVDRQVVTRPTVRFKGTAVAATKAAADVRRLDARPPRAARRGLARPCGGGGSGTGS